MRPALLHLLTPSLLAAVLAGQNPAGAAVPCEPCLIPLHTMASDAIGGDYGLWAAGPNYKASFHDGFTFFPRRGPDRDLVGWRWQTTSVRQGSVNLVTQAARATTTDWRHEFDHGGVVEAYDVRKDGIEQSFVIPRPSGAGDIVISGRITGDLHTEIVPGAVQGLEFSDSERPVVRYGRAIAFDFAGSRTEVATSYDGSHVHLTLAAAFLEHAVYPVTIDPLTSPIVDSYGASPIFRTAIGVDNSSAAGKVLLGFIQEFAANDRDMVVMMKEKNFISVWPVYGDISTVWSTTRVDIAHVDGADRFVVAFQREYSATGRAIKLYFHEQNNISAFSGTLAQPNSPVLRRWQEPRVCGSRGAGNRALVVFEEDGNTIPGSSNRTRVLCMRAFPQSGTFNPPIDLDLSQGQDDDNEAPVVEPYNEAPNTWTVVWRKWNSPSLLHSIRAARVDQGGTVIDNSLLLSTSDPVSHLAFAGSWLANPILRGRHVVAWVRQDSNGQAVETRRTYQAVTGPVAVGPVRTIAASSSQSYDNVALAHDHITHSHWALTYQDNSALFGATAHVARLGHTGGVTESHIMASGAETPRGSAVAFGEPGGMQRFYVAYSLVRPQGAGNVAWHELTYDSNAGTSLYGSTCNQNSTIQATTLPLAGEEFFGIAVSPVASFELVVFVIGLGQGILPLQPYGVPSGCDLLIDANGALSVVHFNHATAGVDTMRLPLPDAPALIGDFFAQAGVFPGVGTPFTTRGLRVRVR